MSAPTQSSTIGADGKGQAPSPQAAVVVATHQLSSELKPVAKEVASAATRAAESRIGAGKELAVEKLSTVASALRRTSDQLRTEQSEITDYVASAARSVERLSGYLKTRSPSQLVGDLQSYARREPALFLGGALLAGLLGGRLLKSTAQSHTPGAGGTGAPAPRPPSVVDGGGGAKVPR